MLIIQAHTESDFQEVRRFWYQIYCVLRGVLREHADHTLGELDDPLLGKGRLFMARDSGGQIVGTIMSTYAFECSLGSYHDFYELDLLSSDASIAIVTKFMIAPDKRGKVLALKLIKYAISKGVKDGITHAVYDANPPTDAFLQRIGGVDWLGVKYHPEFGDVRVMMHRLRDDFQVLSSAGHHLADCFSNVITSEV
jgi:hypothetical protein